MYKPKPRQKARENPTEKTRGNKETYRKENTQNAKTNGNQKNVRLPQKTNRNYNINTCPR
jgi:hypothetical protein